MAQPLHQRIVYFIAAAFATFLAFATHVYRRVEAVVNYATGSIKLFGVFRTVYRLPLSGLQRLTAYVRTSAAGFVAMLRNARMVRNC